MHVCQIMLVEADSPEEAFDAVEGALSESPSWSDWHEASGASTKDFAGRWSNAVFFTPNKNGEPDPDAEIANHLCYADEPALAELVIEKFLQQRLDDIRRYQADAVDLSTYKYDPYAKTWDMPLYTTKKLAELLNDDWVADSAIYDLTGWTTNLASFIERVKTAPEKQYLIPVDLHY